MSGIWIETQKRNQIKQCNDVRLLELSGDDTKKPIGIIKCYDIMLAKYDLYRAREVFDSLMKDVNNAISKGLLEKQIIRLPEA